MSYRALSFRLDSYAVKRTRRKRRKRCSGERGETWEGGQQHPFLRAASIIKRCIFFLEDNDNINNNNEGPIRRRPFFSFFFLFSPFSPFLFFYFFLYYMKLSYRVLSIFINCRLFMH